MTARGLPERAAWRALAAAAPGSNPFFAPGILEAALTALAGDKVTVAAATNAAGRLVALAPVVPMRLGRLVPAIAVWTHLYGPLGTPLIDPDDPDAAIAGLIAAMEGARRGKRILVFPDLPLDGVVADALRRFAAKAGRLIEVVGAHARAVLRPAEVTGGVRAALPAKTRKELGRQLRRLGDLGPVRFSSATTAADLPAALDVFLALEATGWKGARGTALALRPEALAFARGLIDRAEPGAVRIDALEAGGRPVAMLIALRSGGTLVTWKIAHDPALGRFSPGVQIMLDASEAYAADRTLSLVDSLASADHPMIDRLWSGRQSVGTFTIGTDGGAFGLALGLLLARTEVTARAKVRALIRRG